MEDSRKEKEKNKSSRNDGIDGINEH